MAIPARDPFIAYLLVHATMLRRSDAPPAAAERLDAHTVALELLADVVRDLPEDDERLLMLATLPSATANSPLARPPTMPSPGSPAHRARCATPFSPGWSTLRVTMPSRGHVITVSSLPSARADSGGLFQLVDLEACPSELLTRPIGADGHARAGSVDRNRHRDPEEE